LCIGCDRVAKAVARTHLSSSQPIHLLGGLLRFQYTENTGAFLGLGARLPEPVRFWLLIVLVGGVLIGMLRFVWISQELNSLGVLGGSLVVGGGFGNLIDRIFNAGAVVDFMDMGVGNLRTGIVNVADVAITIGAGILLVSSLFLGHSEKESTPVERV
jgi:signal peptidase II